MNQPVPDTQRAIQLVGPGQMIFNEKKPVPPPRGRQILCRVEAVGLCFSDLKLLDQFASHPRKSEIIAGIDERVLRELPSYVPGNRPTVPGHEAVVRVSAVGDEVKHFRLGERYLVQTDYRWLCTAQANAAFGYNLEGALQEYVLLDERLITSPAGEVLMLPASDALSASAIALIEPWACVERAYAERQRLTWKQGHPLNIVESFLPEDREGRSHRLAQLPDGAHNDIVYFGACADTVEQLFPKLAPGGLLAICTRGDRFDRRVSVPVGRVHYAGLRVVGTTSSGPGPALNAIPLTPELRPGNRINIIGAGGPMGVMHVVRALCQGVEGISVFAGDLDEGRLAYLRQLAEPLAARNGVEFHTYGPASPAPGGSFDYIVIMVPSPALVAQAVEQAAPGAIINIFAGIPADVSAEIDLNSYVEKQLYFIGTSGSVLDDMKAVLARVEAGRLDTDLSVAAVSGLEGAQEGLRAIAERRLAGKIIVYPGCRGLGLMALEDMQEELPAVAGLLDSGRWNRCAEKALWKVYGQQQ